MPCIKHFQILGNVIESHVETIARQRGVCLAEAYDEVIQHLKNNSAQWRSGEPPLIPYQNPLCRIAYLYGTAPVNANLIEHVFEEDTELAHYVEVLQNEKGQVSVCAFGGGPGTELLGIAKWIENRCFPAQIALEFLLLDRVNEWLDSWLAIKRQIELRFRENLGANRNNWPLTITGSFSTIDITNTTDFGNLVTVFDQDIYVLSYVVSEIFGNVQNLRSFATYMAEYAPSGARFLFVDRKEPRWKTEVSNLAAEAGITLSAFHDAFSNMSTDEQKTDLGRIYDALHEKWEPRVTWNAFWVVGTKGSG